MAAVGDVNVGSSRHAHMMRLIRALHFIAAFSQFTYQAAHQELIKYHYRYFILLNSHTFNAIFISGQCAPRNHPHQSSLPSAGQGGQLASSRLEAAVGLFYSKGLALSTLHSYCSSQQRYLKFCKDNGALCAIPTCEQTLCLFIAQLALDKLN